MFKTRPEDFTFEQKEYIVKSTFHNYQLLCSIYGIIKCPSCYSKMALGFQFKKDGNPYNSIENYQQLHLRLGFRLVPNEYNNIARVEIDHLTPCYKGGTASIDNGVMICENCNRIFREFLSKEEKLLLLNYDTEFMQCDGMELASNNSHFKIIQDGKIIYNDKDIVASILHRRSLNKQDLDIIPMYDYKLDKNVIH